jgi:hypothetical protein
MEGLTAMMKAALDTTTTAVLLLCKKQEGNCVLFKLEPNALMSFCAWWVVGYLSSTANR